MMNLPEEECRKYWKTLQMANVGWWEADFEEHMYCCSDFLQELFGLTGNSISFDDFSNLICEEYRKRILAELNAFKTIPTYEQVFPVHTTQGVQWVSVKVGKCAKSADGHTRVFGIMQLITRQRLAADEQSISRLNGMLYRFNGISHTLLDILGKDETNSIIDKILAEFLEQFQGDRIYIVEYDPKTKQQHCLHEQCGNAASGIWQGKRQPLDTTGWWASRILSGAPIVIAHTTELPEEAEKVRQLMDRTGIKSIMGFPLNSQKGVWGYMALEIRHEHREWRNEDYMWFSALANLISICIELRRAKDRAEESDRLKSAFLANMSHEIRTPLNAIVGFSSLVAAAQSPEERQEYLSIIKKNNDLLLQLVSDILDLSKIEAGMVKINRRQIDVNGMCREIAESMRMKTRNQVQLLFRPQAPLYLNADEGRVRQVINNFISNAIKFTDRGSITLSCILTDDQNVKISVSDTGKGIPAGQLKNIFNRFVKLDNFVPGTGLGLSICESLIKQMGGKIGVTSTEGKGSCFWFTLPKS